MKRLAVIGAGPIGIAAGIGALDRGFDVTVIEKGEAGQALQSWGSTRFFTPLRMNVTPRMLELLGPDAPKPDALLTGSEMIDRVLKPLASRLPLRENTRVTAIGRRGLTRGDYAGHPLRAERPFRLILNDEEPLEADVVFDATGGFAIPNPLGTGGLPARGEGKLTQKPIRTLGALQEQLESLRGKRVLLVGHGHSAATAIQMLHGIADVTWVVRTMKQRPVEEVANDPLPERARVVSAANDLAHTTRMERRCMVDALDERNGAIEARLSNGKTIPCDAVVALTGFHPNGNMHSELNAETSPVTEGAARLSRAIAGITDCLSVPRVTTNDLFSGEPNFFFVGSRSYGRSRTFLLQTGLAQLEMILQCL